MLIFMDAFFGFLRSIELYLVLALFVLSIYLAVYLAMLRSRMRKIFRAGNLDIESAILKLQEIRN